MSLLTLDEQIVRFYLFLCICPWNCLLIVFDIVSSCDLLDRLTTITCVVKYIIIITMHYWIYVTVLDDQMVRLFYCICVFTFFEAVDRTCLIHTAGVMRSNFHPLHFLLLWKCIICILLLLLRNDDILLLAFIFIQLMKWWYDIVLKRKECKLLALNAACLTMNYKKVVGCVFTTNLTWGHNALSHPYYRGLIMFYF